MASSQTSIFNTLEPPRTPWTRWITSLLIHAALIVALVAIPVTVHQAVISHYTVVSLEDPHLSPPPPMKVKPVVVRPQPVPEKTPPPVIVKKTLVPPPVVHEQKPLVQPQVIEPPKIEAARLEQPKFELSVPKAPEAPKAPPREVKMGGFGDPMGVQPTNTPTKGLIVAQTGSFDMPLGSGNGGANGHGKVVASAGFGDAGVPGGTGYGRRSAGPIQTAGFDNYQTAVATPAVVRRTTPAVTPVEITFKPKPVYTPEAREKKVEGEVQLEVLFRASGQVEVIRVVRGLGLGLDESARAAASQIRFHPATTDGNPTDMRGIVHIVFELS